MDNRGSGGNSFLLGIVVGAAAVFLLGTDKGRKVLKTVTEEGFEGLSDIIERAEEEIIKDHGDEPEPEAESIEVQESQKESPEGTLEANGNGIKKEVKKRFFRRPSKS